MFKSAGKGCRQTAAWFTECTKEEVQAKIAEFWDTRVQGDTNMWSALRAACDSADSGAFHPDTAEAILKASGLTMHQGYLLVCYDELGFKYELPPFVVNEPTSYGETKTDPKPPTQAGVPLTIVIRSVKRPDATVNVTTTDTGKKLKSVYAEQAKAEGNRLFFNGREIKDGSYLTNLSPGVVVQAMGS